MLNIYVYSIYTYDILIPKFVLSLILLGSEVCQLINERLQKQQEIKRDYEIRNFQSISIGNMEFQEEYNFDLETAAQKLKKKNLNNERKRFQCPLIRQYPCKSIEGINHGTF